MSVIGKKKDEWVVVTLTDFAQPGRREELRHHFSTDAAVRAWDNILKIYANYTQGIRVWQETKEGEVLNDSAS